MSRYEFQFASTHQHHSAFVGNTAELRIQGAVMADEALPQTRYVPFHMPVTDVPQRQAGGDVRVLMGHKGAAHRRWLYYLSQGGQYLGKNFEAARIQQDALPVGLDNVDVRIDHPALFLVVQDPPA